MKVRKVHKAKWDNGWGRYGFDYACGLVKGDDAFKSGQALPVVRWKSVTCKSCLKKRPKGGRG